ncbi:MAG: single-stranded-DNA-specific exonuclease RecJ, partial [Gemmatimonadales bacterium]
YDFGPAGVAEAGRVGASLIITCDCGINVVDTVRQAREAGMDVIVTDHHLPGPVLPDALAVIDPQRPDDTSNAGILCGTGVAFKLVQALTPALGLPEALPMHFLDIVALATVADLVPLTGENRALVRHGLRLMANTRWPGLRALIQVSGLAGREIRAGHLGFQIGPRLNAVGRIGDAMDGLRLLLTEDQAEAARLADHLNRLNEQRQAMDQRMLDQALEQMTGFDNLEKMAGLVLAADDWHPGVVGIVASRVVERYGRPTFMVALEGDLGKGSGRSVRRFNLHDALAGCHDLLERYGGHAMAAGLTIRRERLPDFRERFAELAAAELGTDDLGPEQRVDLVLSLAEATEDLERLSRYLEPCGMGNPTPVFGARGIRFEDPRRVGNGHLKGLLRLDDACLPVIGFSWADRAPWVSDGPVDAAFRLERNEWQGRVSLQARLQALGPCA